MHNVIRMMGLIPGLPLHSPKVVWEGKRGPGKSHHLSDVTWRSAIMCWIKIWMGANISMITIIALQIQAPPFSLKWDWGMKWGASCFLFRKYHLFQSSNFVNYGSSLFTDEIIPWRLRIFKRSLLIYKAHSCHIYIMCLPWATLYPQTKLGHSTKTLVYHLK